MEKRKNREKLLKEQAEKVDLTIGFDNFTPTKRKKNKRDFYN